MASILDISIATLARIEIGASHDTNTIKRIEVFFNFPEVALWELKKTGGWLHSKLLAKLYDHFNEMKDGPGKGLKKDLS